ncbi:MAG: NADH-quinone oxidoreductase subunit L [Coriobacteriia bacterium]|nr:NADH-quinone oxidoreductase subunit L [Coriobacteriia bacterium]
MQYSALLIPTLPILAFLVLLLLPQRWRNKLMIIAPAAMITSAVLAIENVIRYYPGRMMLVPIYHFVYELGSVAEKTLNMAISVDSIGMLMLAMVTIVGACVQVYSLSYMKDDERRGWYFTVMSLFTAAMLILVMSGDLLLIFVMWEVMGVCSYLLIGFWYREKAPRQASQKAFLVTRAADCGFFIALAAIFMASGTFKIDQIIASAPSWPTWVVGVVCVGLLWAAMGKSAQFPLNVWLPDAMAGPTPGSALIHAATMVAAGVFLIARMLPIFELYPLVMTIMCWIGIITAILGAALACFQEDLKGVLAFSTISQLGAMFIALGAGSAVIALYHLMTHAFFKSLLFLAAGIIIHAVHTQDINKMGGLAKRMPWTTGVFAIGSLALAGVFPLSGFFSKDEIFTVLFHEHYYLRFAFMALMGMLTALYVTKTFLRVFLGPDRHPDAHDGSLIEMIPVTVLAAITLFGGLGSVAFVRYLGYEGHWPSLLIAGISSLAVLVGATFGFLAYRGVFDKYKPALHPIGVAFDHRLYTDDAYDTGIVRPFIWLSDRLWAFDNKVIDGIVNGVVALYLQLTQFGSWFDHTIIDGIVNGVSAAYVGLTTLTHRFDLGIIDGFINGLADVSHRFGHAFRALQTGRLHTYQRIAIGSAIALLFVIVVLKGM